MAGGYILILGNGLERFANRRLSLTARPSASVLSIGGQALTAMSLFK